MYILVTFFPQKQLGVLQFECDQAQVVKREADRLRQRVSTMEGYVSYGSTLMYASTKLIYLFSPLTLPDSRGFFETRRRRWRPW